MVSNSRMLASNVGVNQGFCLAGPEGISCVGDEERRGVPLSLALESTSIRSLGIMTFSALEQGSLISPLQTKLRNVHDHG